MLLREHEPTKNLLLLELLPRAAQGTGECGSATDDGRRSVDAGACGRSATLQSSHRRAAATCLSHSMTGCRNTGSAQHQQQRLAHCMGPVSVLKLIISAVWCK